MREPCGVLNRTGRPVFLNRLGKAFQGGPSRGPLFNKNRLQPPPMLGEAAQHQASGIFNESRQVIGIYMLSLFSADTEGGEGNLFSGRGHDEDGDH